jgi:hypothetical protein
MKFYSVYGNCQGMVFAAFLNNNPTFRKFFRYIPLSPCNQITDVEIDDFIEKQIKKVDLFIYVPVGDDYRNNYKFSSNFFISHLRTDCAKIVFPSLYYHVYDPQMTYLEDENGERIHIPHDYHDKMLIKTFIENRLLTNEEIFHKYLTFINNHENFNKEEILNTVKSNYKELKRREDLLEKDKRNNLVIKVADFINENYQNKRLFYSLNHPSKYLYLFMREQLFEHLGIKINEPDLDPYLDPHSDFVFGIFPPVKNFLKIRFEDTASFPADGISYIQYLEYYRRFNPKTLTKIGIYPTGGWFIFNKNWSDDEITHRWAESEEATIIIYNDQTVPVDHHILFTIFVIKPQTIKISVNDRYLKEVDFTGGDRSSFIHLEVQLNSGENRLEFLSDTPPSSPGENDKRLLSFAIREFSAVKESDLSIREPR